MAKPISFPEVTEVENFPDGGPKTALPVEKTAYSSISCWKLSENELRRVAETGEIWVATQLLRIDGQKVQPALFVGAEKEEVRATANTRPGPIG